MIQYGLEITKAGNGDLDGLDDLDLLHYSWMTLGLLLDYSWIAWIAWIAAGS